MSIFDSIEEEYQSKIEKLQVELDKHKQIGGIAMKCGHPIQCAYSESYIDGGNKCSICVLEAKLEQLQAELDIEKGEVEVLAKALANANKVRKQLKAELEKHQKK